MSKNNSLITKDGVSYLIPFILVTFCFALWGFANDITNPMVKAFSKIFRMSVTDGTLVQVAFYGGYFCMAFPAAIFIRKYSYKAGVLMGLGLYAAGALLFFPSKSIGLYGCFLIAYFIMTCGLSFLETSCNPYILTMGPEETATRRLNMAQCFNPCGSIIGMFVAMNFIQAKLNPMSSDDRALLSDTEFEAMKDADLSILISPYLIIGLVIVAMFLIILFAKMPKNGDQSHDIHFLPTLRRIFSLKYYREGVIAQFFYVGAQIMCWTFIIQYGTRVFMEEGIVWHEGIHGRRDGRAVCRGTVPAFQYLRHDILYLFPFHCHLSDEVDEARQVACHLRCACHDLHGGCHPVPEQIWCILPGMCQRMHVPDVPHHLRHCP